MTSIALPSYFTGVFHRVSLTLHAPADSPARLNAPAELFTTGLELDRAIWLLVLSKDGLAWSATHRFPIDDSKGDGKSATMGRMAFSGLSGLFLPSESDGKPEELLWTKEQRRIQMTLNHFIDARGQWATRRQTFWVRLEAEGGSQAEFKMIEDGGDGEPVGYTEIWRHVPASTALTGVPKVLVVSCRDVGATDNEEANLLGSLHGAVTLAFPIAIVQLGKGRPDNDFVSQRWDFEGGQWNFTDQWGGKGPNGDSLLDRLPFGQSDGLGKLMGKKLAVGDVLGEQTLPDGTKVFWKVEVVEYD